ncbi:MAG: response regulator [Chloroflexi bacterium]|nr:response regulator [Chloroflexota bacterium]
MRTAIADVLASVPGCNIVGQGANGLEALELARALHPDLIVMDLHMPQMGGLEATGLIKAELPYTQIVLVSTVMDPDLNTEGLKLGAVACLEKGPDLWHRLQGIVRKLCQEPAISCADAG